MFAILERLVTGDERVVADFQTAVQFWREFFEMHRDDDDETLADAIAHNQIPFEVELKMNRYFAKSIMPVAMLSALYDFTNGFEDNRELAERVVRVTERSMVSLEVKGSALRTAAAIFHLDDR